MPKTEKPKTATKTGKTAKKSVQKSVAKTKPASKAKKPAARKSGKDALAEIPGKALVLSSQVVWQSPVFRIVHDKIVEPGGYRNERDVIRHNGSVVILAFDATSSKRDPWIVMERQYRHAAGQFLWELPAGKIEEGEDPLAGAQRELAEETGYVAKKWKPLVEYFASPGFLGESMKIFLAEGLIAGDAHPEEDEKIELRLVKLSEILKMIDKGLILDGKTLTGILLFERARNRKRKN